MKAMHTKEAKELLNDIADRIDKIYTLLQKNEKRLRRQNRH